MRAKTNLLREVEKERQTNERHCLQVKQERLRFQDLAQTWLMQDVPRLVVNWYTRLAVLTHSKYLDSAVVVTRCQQIARDTVG